MYKITLYDKNCCPIFDGTTSFFTDDIEEFEERWLPNADEAQAKRYFQSKAGEIVSDYYLDCLELNIFQEDTEAKEYFCRTYHLSQKMFELYNTYKCSMMIYAESATIKVRGIKFNKKNYVIGQYELCGVCKCTPLTDTITKYSSVTAWGNPICENNIEYKPFWEETPEGRSPILYTKDDFKNDTIATYCWVTIAEGIPEKAMYTKFTQADEKLFVRLMRDIPGEAG